MLCRPGSSSSGLCLSFQHDVSTFCSFVFGHCIHLLACVKMFISLFVFPPPFLTPPLLLLYPIPPHNLLPFLPLLPSLPFIPPPRHILQILIQTP